MATAEQIKSLIRSHWSDDQERFFTIALQVAAHEAQQGHSELAQQIRAILDQTRREKISRAVADLLPELHGLLQSENPRTSLATLVLPRNMLLRIQRILHEHLQRSKLKQHGLSHRRKILLIGSPGTGKTLTARVLAHELKLPLHTVQVDKIVTKFMGETSAKLRQIFDVVPRRAGVYFFDEFDAIAGGRELENDVGEMRRVLNALLQFIEQDTSDNLIVAATNSPNLLDKAIFRRFDDILTYELPDVMDRRRLIQNSLPNAISKQFRWNVTLKMSAGLSSADIVHACRDALKAAILNDENFVSTSGLKSSLQDRKHRHSR